MSRPFVRTSGEETGGDPARQSIVSNPSGRPEEQTINEGEMQPPPSRGTEMTEQETLDRITANTSPTHGHNGTASITDSVRPLQRKPGDGRKLTVNVDKNYKNVGNLPTPVRTPRSFRSSFLMPGRNDSGQGSSNREIEGGEKLESVASSPQLPPQDHVDKPQPKKEKAEQKRGYNYQYFEGNTVFCFRGRLQNSKHRPVNLATGSAVIVPCILFLIFSATWIWSNISPAIPVTFAYVFYICISSFIHATCSDPGVSAPHLQPAR
jgi:palmitoyltransferase ZDHHC9/14/18